MISIKGLTELIIVILTVKLILANYKPPIQESIQAIICIAIGIVIGVFMNPTKDGFITSIIGTSFAFYGEDLLNAFKNVKNLKKVDDEIKDVD